GFAPLPSSHGRNPGLPGRGSSLRTALKGGVSNRSQFYDEEALTTANTTGTTKNKESPVIPANAGIQERTFRRNTPQAKPPS
ncbi:MAG: hypothetical protein LBI87_11670, partial [Candidatus Accumulibacter sp.]|nr:hypothetical protein [Accumulibacter sp.]